MLISFGEVVTGALVNAIAVVGRQVSKAVAGLRKADEGLATARWFETFRLTGAPPDLPGLSPSAAERLVGVLGGDEIQAALQQLLAVRLTDAPETDAARTRDALQVAVAAAAPGAAAFGGALAGYYDDQVCALVARLEGEEPSLLAQIRSEAFSARIITVLQAIEGHTAALAEGERRGGDGPALSGPPAGRLLAGVTDPFDLEMHRAVQAGDAPAGLPVLPAYVSREHDRELAELVRAAAAGASGIAVLVGGSSTGKTRACWEALELLREQDPPWRLWHPIDPSRPEAALRELPAVGPRTVVWLNEVQLYLDVAAGGQGERVAAGLRQLLRDPARTPVLVLATLWPEFWDRLTARPPAAEEDLHAQARELLTGRDIAVPSAFTAAQVEQLAGSVDPRLALAAAAAQDGQVTQFLAGAPELLARYRNAPPAAKALTDAAIDARRLGTGVALPLAFLEAAAPGYLSDADWDGLSEDWLGQALAYTSAPANGIRGPLSRIRPRVAGGATPAPGPAYRLADYLEEHGRQHRKSQIPPAGFWAAAADHVSPADQAALGDAAAARGLYRDAAQLHKNAAAAGNLRAASYLSGRPSCLRDDARPVRWAVAHGALDEPGAVAELLHKVREAGGGDQGTVLLSRDPAARVSLDDPGAVARLLDELREAGARDQGTVLLSRDPAARVSLDDPGAVARLLDELREAGARDQVTVLLSRDPAARVSLADPLGVSGLLGGLREAGAQDQVAALADRAAAHVPLDNPVGVHDLLGRLWGVGAERQAAALADRAAAHVSLDDDLAVSYLLEDLPRVGAEEQAAALADRAIVHVPLDDPGAVAALLQSLREAGAYDQAIALADRAIPRLSLDDPGAVAALLQSLRAAQARDQIIVLLDRDPAARVSLHDPRAVSWLLEALLEMGAGQQATVLANRAAAHAPLADPHVVILLGVLWSWRAQDQVTALLRRDLAAHVPLDDPSAVAALLKILLKTGAHDQIATLLRRDPAACVSLDDPSPSVWPPPLKTLLESLQEAGAREQAAVLAERLPGAGKFDLFRQQQDRRDPFRFGRETDGRPVEPWDWDDLDLWLVPDRGNREATLSSSYRRPAEFREVSLHNSLSGRPELHCKAQLSAPAPRSLHSDRTVGSAAGGRVGAGACRPGSGADPAKTARPSYGPLGSAGAGVVVSWRHGPHSASRTRIHPRRSVQVIVFPQCADSESQARGGIEYEHSMAARAPCRAMHRCGAQ